MLRYFTAGKTLEKEFNILLLFHQNNHKYPEWNLSIEGMAEPVSTWVNQYSLDKKNYSSALL